MVLALKKWFLLGILPTLATFAAIMTICLTLLSAITLSSTTASTECTDQQEISNALMATPANTDGTEKSIFEYLTQKEGFSGAGGSGALAVAKRESSFDIKAINESGGVAGVFQWSGFSNTVNGTRITAEGSIKAGDTSTLTLENELKLVSFELKHSYVNVKTKVGTATDPEQAALDWSQYYEGVSLGDSQTKQTQIKADASKYYVKYGGKSIPSSIKNAASEGIDTTVSSEEAEANEGCEVGEGTGKQVSGTIPMGTYYDQLSPEIKKAIGKRPTFKSYPDDPTSAPWGHQCAWYVTYRAKEMGFNESTTAEGNGAVWGQSDANFTTEVGKPVAHAAVDFKMGQGGRGTSEAGHTAFVEYVNPDGSMIISECNVAKGHSGMDRITATQPEESYATISAADAKNLTYVTPKGKG